MGRSRRQSLAQRLRREQHRAVRSGCRKFESFPSDKANADVRQMLGRKGEAWAAESGTDRLRLIRYAPATQ